VVVTTPSDVSLQDGRKAIEMFRQVKVDIIGIAENMGAFHCPHCKHEIDIFSKGGGLKTAEQFGVPFLGSIELDPEIRKGGDTGNPVALAGEDSEHAKSLYAFTRKVIERVKDLQATNENVISIQ
jgi:ATP-binding protein involved in chromosome partitioning